MQPMSGVPDPGSVATSVALFELARRVLGPTADYLGDELVTWTRRRVKNFQRILENASTKVGDGRGAVPERVLFEVLDRGSRWSDEVGAAYFGGVLASSKTGHSRDDRGAAMAGLIDRLSTYQLRFHYLLYAAARSALIPLRDRLSIRSAELPPYVASVFVREADFEKAFGLEEGEDLGIILGHSFWGLDREDLLTNWGAGTPESLKKLHSHKIQEPGLAFGITQVGTDLFMWANGHGDLDIDAFLDPDVPMEIGPDFGLTPPPGSSIWELPNPPKEPKGR